MKLSWAASRVSNGRRCIAGIGIHALVCHGSHGTNLQPLIAILTVMQVGQAKSDVWVGWGIADVIG